MMVNASANRLTRRSYGEAERVVLPPVPPGPEADVSRPREIASTVAACLASIAGAWKLVDATSGPSSMVVVAAAIAASDVHTSHGPRGPTGRS